MEAVPSDEGAYLFNGTILFYLNLVFFLLIHILLYSKEYVYLVEANIRNFLWHSDFFCIYDQSLLFFSSKGELLDSHVCTRFTCVHRCAPGTCLLEGGQRKLHCNINTWDSSTQVTRIINNDGNTRFEFYVNLLQNNDPISLTTIYVILQQT